jgi:hypothetical protein
VIQTAAEGNSNVQIRMGDEIESLDLGMQRIVAIWFLFMGITGFCPQNK